jgi:phosphoglycerol transferase MdoB-like AlkP superfamily enzyme
MVGYLLSASSALPIAIARRLPKVGPNAALLLGGLVLPNALSFATLFHLIDIGLPPRPYAILLYVIVAISARRVPFYVTAGLFVTVLVHDLVCTLSLMFGLAPVELFTAIRFALRVHIFNSPLYVLLSAVLVLNFAIILRLMRDRARLLKGNLLLLAGAATVFAAADYASNTSPYFSFGSVLGRNQPVITAGEASGFDTVAGKNGRNVIVVVVESLGYLADPHARSAISAPLSGTEIEQRYILTSGHSGYYGSTTAGEMRELCDTRTPYQELTKELAQECLPAQLKHKGYGTLAFHGFSGHMFDRTGWYPALGFDKTLFGEDLLPKMHRSCGSAFRGPCDTDVAQVIAEEAAKSKKPTFVYWVTLNTHIPVAPGDARANFNCETDRTVFPRPGVCRMGELWHDLFESIARLALDPAIGPSEILIVGDHAPPLWSRTGREMFVPGQVAWYRLTPRSQ